MLQEDTTRKWATRALIVLFLVLPFATPALAQPPPESPRSEEAASRMEAEVARDLARLDEVLKLKSFPASSALGPARMAAAIEARGDGEPAQELLRGLAAELRRLRSNRPLLPGDDEQRSDRPSLSEDAALERARTLARIRKRLSLIHRKLDLPGRSAGIVTRSFADAPERLAQAAAYRNGADDCADAVLVDLGAYKGSTGSATVDGDASCAGPVATPDVWYRFVAPETGSYTFATREMHNGTLEDTVLSLHAGCPLPGGDSQEIACSDDGGEGLFSSVSRPMTAGEEILVRISGFGGDIGSYEMVVSQGRSLRGTVTEEGTGSPLAGVTIVVTDRWEELRFESTTSSDGHYKVSVPRYGIDFYAHARSDEHAIEWYDGYDCTYGDDCSIFDVADPIYVETGDAGGVDFNLEPAGSITGRITTSEASPPETVYGTIHLYDDSGSHIRSFTTRSDGTYDIAGVVPGNYHVRAEAYGYRSELWDDHPCTPCDPTTGEAVVVTAGVTASGIDFELDPLGSISGTVFEQGSGDPIEAGWVELYRVDGSYVDERSPGFDGGFFFEAVLPGEYFLRVTTNLHLDEVFDDVPCEPTCDVTTGTLLAVPLGTAVGGIEFLLAPKSSISGTVLEEGTEQPVGMSVLLYDASGAFLTSASVYEGHETYRFAGLSAGTYYVKAGYFPGSTEKTHAQELYDDLPCLGECDPTAGTPIVLGDSTTATGLDFRVVPRGSVTGRVTNAASGEPVLEHVAVQAFFSDGTKAGLGFIQPDGTYEIPYLAPASYRVGTSSFAWKDEMYDDIPCGAPCDRTQGASVPVQSGQTTPGVDFALGRWGSIAGQVQGFQDSTLLGRVQLFDSSGSLLDDQEVFFNSASTAFPYAFYELTPGTYFVKADELGTDELQAEVFSDLPCEPDCEVTAGTPTVVGDGEPVSGIDFLLASCSQHSFVELVSTIISDYRKFLACDRITVNDVELLTGSALTLRSGRIVVFGDGFAMEPDARLEVVIDPEWADD